MTSGVVDGQHREPVCPSCNATEIERHGQTVRLHEEDCPRSDIPTQEHPDWVKEIRPHLDEALDTNQPVFVNGLVLVPDSSAEYAIEQGVLSREYLEKSQEFIRTADNRSCYVWRDPREEIDG